uniref:spindle assembly abnormal protein 6-like isoform X2 n=1 Tax=Monopterus albus TaxID=43700 RepID=UPI0009B2F112|nr:spindle assembly abnormal protein 6-like isoform X2 [Monopterus albus]
MPPPKDGLNLSRDKTQLKKKNARLQGEKEEIQGSVKTLKELENQRDQVKLELENLRDELKVKLEEVEREKEKNKEELSLVETELTEKQMAYEKPEELLRQKEKLLQDQWKLDQTKKDNEKLLLDMERLLESIEIQVTRNTDVHIYMD